MNISLAGLLPALIALCAHAGIAHAADPTSWISNTARSGDFALVDAAGSASLVIDKADAKVVAIAASDLAADIEKVTGRKPAVDGKAAAKSVIIGTFGRSALVDELARSGKLDVAQLRGAWESYVIATVDKPLPGVANALVIAGSDPRGTAYGAFELSQAIGVSPWNWWADVAPTHQDAVYVAGGTRRFGPPSVNYRGIFINDEDSGMHRWTSKTFEPEYGGIGPNTYEKVFELLLRLKAIRCGPRCTRPPNRSTPTGATRRWPATTPS
jgi:hypothetical protein